MRAVATKPLRGFASPPPFLQSACGYSENWLRISLRATPRDPNGKDNAQCRDPNEHRVSLRKSTYV